MYALVLLVITICWLSPVSLAVASPVFQKCEACRIVADAFLGRLSSERVRNHLDMRHRLDKDGKRYGKVIDYKVSELRASEILDDLCEDMSHYGMTKAAAPETDGADAAGQAVAEWTWLLKGADSYGDLEKLTGEPAKQMSKRLKNYCYGVIERTEDSLAKYLASESDHHEGLDEFLCERLVGHCEGSQDGSGGEGDSDVKSEL
eukprot:jgi/Ulvmu1/309/UM001_0313.1